VSLLKTRFKVEIFDSFPNSEGIVHVRLFVLIPSPHSSQLPYAESLASCAGMVVARH
jgi:hypothetical protein